MLRLVLALLLLGLSGPCLAQGNDATAVQNVADAVAKPTPATPQPSDIEHLRAELQLKRENAVLQARNELNDVAYSRLEILIGAFGVVIAVVGLVFGLSTREVAIAKVKEGTAEIRIEMEKLRDETRHLADEGRSHLEGLRASRSEASQIIDGLKMGELPSSAEDRRTVLDAAKIAKKKPPRERTPDELRSLIVAASINEDWTSVYDHARALLYLSESDEETAYALSTLAKSLDRMGRRNDELEIYEQIISQFGNSKIQSIVYDVLWAMSCKVATLGQLNRFDEALLSFDDIIERFGSSKDPYIRVGVGKAIYNKACGAALQKDVKLAIDTLRQWLAYLGEFDCEKVANDADFDSIRTDPAFTALLTEMGCTPKTKRVPAKRKPKPKTSK